MADIVLGGEEIRRPGRLEFGIEAAAIRIDLVLIRIDDLGQRIVFKRQGKLEQGIGSQQPFFRNVKDELPAPFGRKRGER